MFVRGGNDYCEPSDIICGYKVEKKLGEGAYATVWKAKSITPAKKMRSGGGNNNIVAIKIFGRDYSTRAYSDEVRTFRKIAAANTQHLLRHKELFAYVNVGADVTVHPCIIMEHFDTTLLAFSSNYVDKHDEELPTKMVKKFVRQTLIGLTHLHDLGFIHADIKPDNILLRTSDLHAVIADFGGCIAAPTSSVTRGTRVYMAPEILIDLEYNNSIDIWSTFVMSFVLMTGDDLFYFDPHGANYHEDLLNYAVHNGLYAMDVDIDVVSDNTIANTSASSSESEETSEKTLLHLATVVHLLGEPPANMVHLFKEYFTKREKEYPEIPKMSLSDFIARNNDMDAAEREPYCDFLRQGLTYDLVRISAKEALALPWLAR